MFFGLLEGWDIIIEVQKQPKLNDDALIVKKNKKMYYKGLDYAEGIWGQPPWTTKQKANYFSSKENNLGLANEKKQISNKNSIIPSTSLVKLV